MLVPVAVLAVVFLLIAVRQVGGVRLQIWQVMLAGAFAVFAAGRISAEAAVAAVNMDVMLFLFGMFVVGQALEDSGFLAQLAYSAFRGAKTQGRLLLYVLFGFGFASAFLMNDTLAIIGTPVVLILARKHGIPTKPMLLALAFAVTIGSVPSPMGNPQNLLIAVNGGMKSPFITFLAHLLLPTILNLFLAYVVLRLFYPEGFHGRGLTHLSEPLKDSSLAAISRISLGVIVVMVAAKIVVVSLGLGVDFRLTYIALAGASPILLASPRRWDVLRRIDWHTLVFFASMFVLMESVWQSGFFQSAIDGLGVDIASTHMIIAVSIVLSQFISNVPLAALYLPLLTHAGASSEGLIALAAGSTIAGNLLILGAASNVIIIHNAERRGEDTLTFWEFARVGLPLTLVNAIVYWLFLS